MEHTIFFSRTYDETMCLMVEARHYLRHAETHDRHRAGPMVGLRMSCEALRVTSRLAQVMAWLMVQKAVHHGELTAEQSLADDRRLSAAEICLDQSHEADEALPHTLRSLMDRSHRLYQRVARIEAMLVLRVLH